MIVLWTIGLSLYVLILLQMVYAAGVERLGWLLRHDFGPWVVSMVVSLVVLVVADEKVYIPIVIPALYFLILFWKILEGVVMLIQEALSRPRRR